MSKYTPVDLEQFKGMTPGPWDLHGPTPDCAFIRTAMGEPVADLRKWHDCDAEFAANARAIAAVPGMVAEIEALREALGEAASPAQSAAGWIPARSVAGACNDNADRWRAMSRGEKPE